MNNRARSKRHQSLVGQLKRSLLIVASLIASIFIFSIPVSIIASPLQHNLDRQKGALQEDVNSILISMVNQETGLRGYITTANSAFLQRFIDGRPQYLLAEQRLASQTQGNDFKKTARALAQVDERANAWYRTFAQVQLHNMQSGQLATARAASTNAFGKVLFDQFRAAVSHLQDAIAQDLAAIQSRLQLFGWIIFLGIVLLAAFAVIVLWRTLTHFFKALRAQLKLLTSTAALLGSGDLSARVQELEYDELNHLGQTFNKMAQDLERTNAEISQQRDELMALNEALEEANRARSQFLSTMSHELRTPLASIIGFSQLLLDDSTTANPSQQQQGNLERILKNGQHLLSLVNDVLDLEKIEAGGMEITYSQVNVRDLLTSVVEETQSLAISRNLVLRADIGDGVDSLESNPVKLRQILLNLVSNALKFTDQGEVTVSARRGDADHLVFSVRDTGIGIPAEMQARVFEAFYQVDGGYTRKTGGTGLGLSIVRELTALLGGTIELVSTPGQGSTFTITLPLKAIHQQIEPAIPRLHARQPQNVSPTSAASAGPTPDKPGEPLETTGGQQNIVLAVDDNPDVLSLIKSALQESPYSFVGVQDPFQVMDLVQKTKPVAIMLDVMMPGLNGWQLLHELRENPATASIPIVMLSVLPETITTGYVLGADDYLIKPFQNGVLLTTLQRLIASQQERSDVSKRETQPAAMRFR